MIGRFETEPKGECVIAVLPVKKNGNNETDPEVLIDALLETMSVKDAAAEAAGTLGRPKKDAYALALRRKSANRDNQTV